MDFNIKLILIALVIFNCLHVPDDAVSKGSWGRRSTKLSDVTNEIYDIQARTHKTSLEDVRDVMMRTLN